MPEERISERCQACGYDLRGLQTSAPGLACPECGVEYQPRAMTRTVVRWRLLRALVAPPLYFGLVVAGLGALTWSGAGWSVQDLALTLVIGPFIAVMVSLWLVARVSHDAPSGRRPSDWVLALLAIAQAVIVIGASLLGLTWLVSGD